MDKAISELKELLNTPLSKEDIVVDEISFYEKDKNKFLTVVLDKTGGIDLDTIVKASKIVSEIIDEMDFPSDEFVLDVTSKERG